MFYIQGKKCADLVRRSSITHIALHPLGDLDNPVTKSIVTCHAIRGHGYWGSSKLQLDAKVYFPGWQQSCGDEEHEAVMVITSGLTEIWMNGSQKSSKVSGSSSPAISSSLAPGMICQTNPRMPTNGYIPRSANRRASKETVLGHTPRAYFFATYGSQDEHETWEHVPRGAPKFDKNMRFLFESSATVQRVD
ncbi:hypothetical protein HYC85_030083 [Camellia sinensis]|uniref:Uncharacterized protein n=1 Tax=Camellia sinensis TaxID=4442 RepID=A0A7J7FZR1_CAMSI|nr:hypothetical protein HYC85_030083 [Camellia sinensis]